MQASAQAAGQKPYQGLHMGGTTVIQLLLPAPAAAAVADAEILGLSATATAAPALPVNLLLGIKPANTGCGVNTAAASHVGYALILICCQYSP